MKRLTILFIAYILSTGLKAQNTSELILDQNKKNVVFGTLGFALLGGVAAIGYERHLYDFKSGALTVQGSTGGWVFWSEGGSFVTLTGGYVHGLENNHFEARLGLLVNYDKNGYEYAYYDDYSADPVKSDYIIYTIGGSVGYRYQKPGNSFVFRTGIGFPDALYASIGYAF